jgi:hypothetical protein
MQQQQVVRVQYTEQLVKMKIIKTLENQTSPPPLPPPGPLPPDPDFFNKA